ncbi:GNAT family N-acetyltransferase [Butyrivibrio sp. AD3002]|uniref:GNAT family N-acetyltransferase n=1 Tax=Butyrivibrio sp. AD3002 TaxID=1280670 RepID=UPI0003B54DF9|nr:GNAT family N-acetyltransferase [Butyrivibrio sp. AD3002]
MMVTKKELKESLLALGVTKGMTLEVHSSLSSFGELEGGAETVIDTLKDIVTEEGSLFMPALRLSKELPLSDDDRKMGVTVKIKVLPSDADRTAMGIVADTFRKLPDTYTGQDTISTSGWGKHGKEAVTSGLDYPIHNGGKALLLGVDIYKLTAMHYVEGITPEDINKQFEPSEEINRKYPPEEWFMEAGHPPVKAWYKIQDMAYEKGLIKEMSIGKCKVMFFDIWSVVSLYENELKRDPYGLWGMKPGLEFRQLTISDLPSLLELYQQLDEDDKQCAFEQSEMVWKEIEENPNIQYFGAIDNGKVVSTCYAVYIPNLTRGNRGICFIENVVTDKEYRNCGLASKVIDMAVAFAKDQHCYKAILQSGIARTGAHRFYENKGFNGASKKAFDMRLE